MKMFKQWSSADMAIPWFLSPDIPRYLEYQLPNYSMMKQYDLLVRGLLEEEAR